MVEHESISEKRHNLLKRYPVRFLRLNTPEEFLALWDNLRQFPLLFDDTTWGRADMFVKLLAQPDVIFYEVGNVGMIWLTTIKRGATADLNLAFWGPITREEKLEVLKVVGTDAFYRYNIKRIGISCYEQNEAIIRMCEACGAKQDGVLRKALMLRGELCNVVVFSLMREEFFGWAGKAEWEPNLIITPDPPPKVEEVVT